MLRMKQCLKRVFNTRTGPLSPATLLALALLVIVPAICCWAFGESITTNRPYAGGTNRFVSMAGTFTLLPGENLKMVRIFTLNAKKQSNSMAQGNIDQTHQTWSTSVGDFQMAYYYTEFTVTYGNTTRNYDTATFTWHP